METDGGCTPSVNLILDFCTAVKSHNIPRRVVVVFFTSRSNSMGKQFLYIQKLYMSHLSVSQPFLPVAQRQIMSAGTLGVPSSSAAMGIDGALASPSGHSRHCAINVSLLAWLNLYYTKLTPIFKYPSASYEYGLRRRLTDKTAQRQCRMCPNP